MDPDDLQAICQALPIFPLPKVVLMPGEVLPLHIFEPRYRALLREVIEGDGVLAMATLKEGGAGLPPEVWPEIGIGRVLRHQPLPDGRSNVLLGWIGQGTITQELPTTQPFRMVQATPHVPSDGGVEAQVERLRMMVLQVGALSPDASAEAQRLIALDGVEMAHSLARKLLDDPDERRLYLVQERVALQVEMVHDRLARFLALGVGPTAEA